MALAIHVYQDKIVMITAEDERDFTPSAAGRQVAEPPGWRRDKSFCMGSPCEFGLQLKPAMAYYK
jgi:hypothetical protein